MKTIIFDYYKYSIERTIEGGMGKVLVLNRLSEASPFDLTHRKHLAAKTFKDGEFVEQNRDFFVKELNIWLKLDFPNIAKLHKVVFIENNLFGIMPFYDTSLRNKLQKEKYLDLETAKLMILNITAPLYEAHKKYKIIHQDLKPENILIDVASNNRKERIYVSDWGIANIQNKYCTDLPRRDWLPPSFIETMRGMGTLPYMSPERFLGYPVSFRQVCVAGAGACRGRPEHERRPGDLAGSGRIRRRLEVIPGEPLLGILEELRGVFLKGRQVMEGVDLVELAGMNEAHEQVPNVSAMLGPVEKRVFAVQNRSF
jgi:serine/threonine protein kinase